MKSILAFASGVALATVAGFFYLQYKAKEKEDSNNSSGSRKKKPGNFDSKMDAPASQPEVLPKSKANKKEASLTKEEATGNTD